MYFINNFFQDPDNIRLIALKQKYETPHSNSGWRGYRCVFPQKLKNIELNIKNTVCRLFGESEKSYSIDSFFHYSLSQTKLTCFPSFEQYKYHVDDTYTIKYAGVVYLHPNPPKHSGTTIIDKNTMEKIDFENVYNRLLCYPSNILHGPTDLFGNNLQSGRLTLTFFIKKIFFNYDET